MQKWIVGLSGAAAAAGALGGLVMLYGGDKPLIGSTAGAAPSPPMMAMPVPVAKIVKRTIPITLDYAARTESIRSIALQPKVAGYIREQHVADGADVKEGDLLYTIDPRDFQAALDQARAQVRRDEAALAYARSNLDRGTTLAQSGILAKDSFDQRTSALRQAEAALAMSEAAARLAEINLGYTEIRAPFSGRLGRNQAPVGTLVSAGSTPLNTLVQLDPVYVTFNPSETELGEIARARSLRPIPADVIRSGSGPATHKGELTFVDNAVDRSTGTIVARATIRNSDLSLLPGQYVRIRLAVAERPDTLMVPQVALGSSQLGKYVYVVGEGNKADQRLVSLGPTDGDLVSVFKGVAEGEHVISGNLQKIGPGAAVQPLPQ